MSDSSKQEQNRKKNEDVVTKLFIMLKDLNISYNAKNQNYQ